MEMMMMKMMVVCSPVDNKACSDHLLRMSCRINCTWVQVCWDCGETVKRQMLFHRCRRLFLKMMVLLADFTFEALSMVNASGCPNRLAFDLGSTLSTFLHVRLEGAS